MLRNLRVFWFLTLAVTTFHAAVASEPLPPASRWVPPDAVITLEVSHPKAVLDLVFDPRVVTAVTSQPAYQELASQPSFRQFRGVITYLEARLNTEWRPGLEELAGAGLTLAVLPEDSWLLMVDANNEEMLGNLHEILVTFARGEAAKQGQSDRVRSADYRGLTGWTFGGDESHAIVGNRALISNKPEILKRVADLRAESNATSLASLPTYQTAKQSAPSDAAAFAFVNMEVIKQHSPLESTLAEGGNPLAALLFAGMTEALRESSWLALGLQVTGDTIAVNARVDAGPPAASGVAAFTLPRQAEDGANPILSVPRRIAGLSLYRDLHAFYAAKDDLFPDRTSGLIFFENMMGIFFSGRDLTEEVLAETKPDIRFVVAQQEYDPEVGVPRVQIPAFAAVFRLRHPDTFRDVAEEAWQKVLGLVNFTRGQQGLPGLIIDRPTHGGTKFTMAYFASSAVKDKTAMAAQFNFRPALAMVDDYMILSSTETLAKDLIDAVEREVAESVRPRAGVHSIVEVDGAQLASILRANRDNFVRQNMIEKGNTKEQAETEIGILLTVIQYVGHIHLDVGTQENQPQARLQVQLNFP